MFIKLHAICILVASQLSLFNSIGNMMQKSFEMDAHFHVFVKA